MADEDEEKQGPEGEDSLDELQEKRTAAEIDADEDEVVFILPGDEEITEDLDSIRVLPKQPDEFICQSCFLVHHASQRYKDTDRCRDCSE